MDEMLDALRRRFHFKKYIIDKPVKYGIKIYVVDARTFYIYNSEVGRHENNPIGQF